MGDKSHPETLFLWATTVAEFLHLSRAFSKEPEKNNSPGHAGDPYRTWHPQIPTLEKGVFGNVSYLQNH